MDLEAFVEKKLGILSPAHLGNGISCSIDGDLWSKGGSVGLWRCLLKKKVGNFGSCKFAPGSDHGKFLVIACIIDGDLVSKGGKFGFWRCLL